MSESKPFTVAVIGGGIVGVVLTLALQRRNINVELYERDQSLVEVGASLGVNISAARALKMCGPEVYAALERVVTRPTDGGVNFEIMDGYNTPSKGSFSYPWDQYAGGVHRAHFLESLAEGLKPNTVKFGKNLSTIEEPEGKDGPLKLVFADGTSTMADAVIGADGVGSHVRRQLLGQDHPSARARYAHKYVYRAVMPMADAEEILGKHQAHVNTIRMGVDSQMVTIPIVHGTMFAVTAIRRDSKPWPSEHKLVLPASKEELQRDFDHWNPQIQSLLSRIDPHHIDRWALFDLAENPLPYFAKGRVAVAGDAAHATTPHLGSGAAFGIEDATVLAELLADEHMKGTPRQVEAAFAAYNQVRKPRGEWLLKHSRDNGIMMEFADPDAGQDMAKIKERMDKNFATAWNEAVVEHVKESKEIFARLAREGGQ